MEILQFLLEQVIRELLMVLLENLGRFLLEQVYIELLIVLWEICESFFLKFLKLNFFCETLEFDLGFLEYPLDLGNWLQ